MIGLLNAETCRMGSPAFISFPHYLGANESLFDQIESGLTPDPDKHSMFIDIEPVIMQWYRTFLQRSSI